MYHRFEENKYPSTNIRNEIFIEHLEEINNAGLEFIGVLKNLKNLLKANIQQKLFTFNY